jgi:hypothetical protein
MIPKCVIEKAMEGGWLERDRPLSPVPPDVLQSMIDWESTALDPKFWQGLGKALGESGRAQSGEPLIFREAKDFFGLVVRGDDTDNFWKALLSRDEPVAA